MEKTQIQTGSTVTTVRLKIKCPGVSGRSDVPPVLPSVLGLALRARRPSASGSARRRCCGHRTRAGGGTGDPRFLWFLLLPFVSPLRHLIFLTGSGSQSGFTPQGLRYVKCRRAAENSVTWWAQRAGGLLPPPSWLHSCDRVGTRRQKGRAVASGSSWKSGDGTVGTRVASTNHLIPPPQSRPAGGSGRAAQRERDW